MVNAILSQPPFALSCYKTSPDSSNPPESEKKMAVTKRDADWALMPPPPPKRQKRPPKVLDEDVYSEALSHIIARDFFPGLLETEAQQEYIEALESKNSTWIREAGRRLTQVMTPRPDGRRSGVRGTAFTPRSLDKTNDTPQEYAREITHETLKARAREDVAREEQPKVDINMSLGAFQAKYTSEDNESFNALLDKQNERRAARHSFFHHGNKFPSARQIAIRRGKQQVLESDDGTTTASNTPYGASKTRSAISAPRPSQDLDSRPASLDSFLNREGPKNHLMFGPDSVEDHMVTRSQLAEHASNAPPKSIRYSATRFQQSPPKADRKVPPSPTMSAIDAAIARTSRTTYSNSGYTGAETPRVNGYAFVDAEPTPSELGTLVTDEEAEAAEREEAMKFLPKPDEAGPNPFKIQGRSKREELHHKLVEKADAGRRKPDRIDELRRLGITPGKTPTPKFTSAPRMRMRDATSMTPAARMLAANIGQTPRSKGAAFEKGSKDWTPIAKLKRAV